MEKFKLKGPLVVIDDDQDDLLLMKEVLEEIGVDKVRLFENSVAALEYLKHTPEQPSMILCDINMPSLTGLQLRQVMVNNDEYRNKTVPFIFITTSAIEEEVEEAFNLYAHGYFIKPHSYPESQKLITNLLTYWSLSNRPRWSE